MKPKTTQALIIFAVVGVIGLGYYLWNQDKKKKAALATTAPAAATVTTT